MATTLPCWYRVGRGLRCKELRWRQSLSIFILMHCQFSKKISCQSYACSSKLILSQMFLFALGSDKKIASLADCYWPLKYTVEKQLSSNDMYLLFPISIGIWTFMFCNPSLFGYSWSFGRSGSMTVFSITAAVLPAVCIQAGMFASFTVGVRHPFLCKRRPLFSLCSCESPRVCRTRGEISYLQAMQQSGWSERSSPGSNPISLPLAQSNDRLYDGGNARRFFYSAPAI